MSHIIIKRPIYRSVSEESQGFYFLIAVVMNYGTKNEKVFFAFYNETKL